MNKFQMFCYVYLALMVVFLNLVYWFDSAMAKGILIVAMYGVIIFGAVSCAILVVALCWYAIDRFVNGMLNIMQGW